MYVHLLQLLRVGAEIITGIPIHYKSYNRCGRCGGGREGRSKRWVGRRREWRAEGVEEMDRGRRGEERRAMVMENDDETGGIGRSG